MYFPQGSFAVVMSAAKKNDTTKMAVKLIDKSKAPNDFVEKFLPKVHAENDVYITKILFLFSDRQAPLR